MQSWMGLSLFEAFDGWRYAVESAQRQRRREDRRRLREERIKFEDAVAKFEYEKIDVSVSVISIFLFIHLAYSNYWRLLSSSSLYGLNPGTIGMMCPFGYMQGLINGNTKSLRSRHIPPCRTLCWIQ